MDKGRTRLFIVSPQPRERVTFKSEGMGKGRSYAPEEEWDEKRKPFSVWYGLGVTTLLYYACFLPFRLTVRESRSPSSSEPKLAGTRMIKEVHRERNTIQMIICVILHILLLGTICLMSYAIVYSSSLSQGKSLTFLQGALFVLGPSISIYYIYTAWFRSEWFEWLVAESSSEARTLPYSWLEIFQNWESAIAPFISLLLNFHNLHTYHIYIFKGGPFRALQESWFGLEGTGLGDLWAWNLFGELVIAVISFINVLSSHMPMIVFQWLSLSFRDKARGFIQMVEVDKVEKYLELERFVKGVNERFGGYILFLVIFTIPYYSSKLVELLRADGSSLGNLVAVFHTFAVFFWLYNLATLSYWIGDGMKTWLNQNYHRLSCQQVSIFLSKVNHDGVALRGGNFFNISYPIIGTLVSMIVTWAFIDQSNH